MLTGEDATVVDSFLCPKCHGHGCDDKKDALSKKVEVNCVAGPSEKRGRVDATQGDEFSGLIVVRHGRVAHFQQSLEVDLNPQ